VVHRIDAQFLLRSFFALCLGACSAPRAEVPTSEPRIPALSLEPDALKSSAVLDALPASPAEPATLAAAAPLGWAALRPLGAADLIREWHATDPASLWLVLEKLVSMRLAVAEAERLGLTLAGEAVALRWSKERARLDETLRAEGLELDDYARDEYGQSPKVFLEGLRSAVGRQMLIERVTRAWVLSSPWLRLRMIVVVNREAMAKLRDRLDAGEAFEDLARELSRDGSASQGGLVPFLVLEEESPLSRHAFSQELGELGEPFTHRGLEVLVRVEERHAGNLQASWKNLGEAVESSLAEFPLTDTEYAHWKVTMEQRYPIDVQPLLELLGVESSG